MTEKTPPRIDPDRGLELALEQSVDILARYALGDAFSKDAEIDVAAIRNATGLSQKAFAEKYGVPVGTLRNWEQGRRTPEGPARALLQVIARDAEIRKDAAKVISLHDAATGADYPLEEVLSPILGDKKARAVVLQIGQGITEGRFGKARAAKAGDRSGAEAPGDARRRRHGARRKSGSAA